ncbi:MAG: elongation factor P maturation arginine rhamnosyltransferase EarP [Fusobacteriaceae bacterium]|nr:elongation factor P maturation arginine rhamnosyltransferase EarP [Fusobacteriaceae bacterium]
MAKACERESRERESCKGQKHGGYASDLDIFCEVIDNYGDIGVVLRLAKEFRRRGGPDIRIRVVVNDLNALAAIHPGIRDVEAQELGGIAFFRDREFREAGRGIARTAIGAFGCDPPEAYLAEGREKGMLLLDLQYLTGEKWAEDFHLKPSMVPGKLRKFFYFPGFTPESGGLLQRPQFRERVRLAPEKFVNKYFGEFSGPQKRLKIVVFSYERDFSGLLEALRKLDKPAALLVCGGKSRAAFGKFIGEFQKKDFGNIHICGKIEMKYAEFFTQDQFEELLNAADVNFVRGEDSAAQAATAGKPFLWELYPQRDNVQLDKLEGFLRTYGKFFPGGAESQAARETSELFRAYNSGDGALRDAPAERYLAFFKNLRTIGEACGAFSAELARSCDLLTKIKTIIQEYAGGKL